MNGELQRWNRNIHYHGLLLELGPADRALDVGCGSGMLTRQLAETCGYVIGIDPHKPSIDEARAATSTSHVEFVVGDAMTHGFAPASFDLITSVAALHHMDARPALARFAWLLKPGGRLGIVGIGRSVFPRDTPRDALAFAATQAHQVAMRTRAWEHAAPMVWPPPLTDRQMKKAAEAILPGVTFRRLLHGRHAIIWTKPADSSETD